MSLLSVCIPVYNGEKYIEDCLNPLIKMDDVQIVCVDDGSSDNSLLMLNKYKENHSNIVVLSQENQGQSMARNKGLEYCDGKYVSFVDVDDWLDTRAIDCLKEIDKEYSYDFIQFGVISEFGYGSLKKELLYPQSKSLDEDESKRMYAYICGLRDDRDLGHDYFGLVSCKFYKREILKGIKFVSDVVGEDTLYAVEAHKRVKTSYFLSEYLYHYRSIDGSFSHRIMKDIIPKSSRMLNEMKKLIDIDKDNLFKRAYYDHAFSKFLWCLRATGFNTIKEINYQVAVIEELMSYDEFGDMLNNVDSIYINDKSKEMLNKLRNKDYKQFIKDTIYG